MKSHKMEQMLIVHISSLSAIIILSIVLLVNSIKTKNKLVMYLSIGTLVVSIGSLTYCLIHHFSEERKKKKAEEEKKKAEEEKNKENQMKSSLKNLASKFPITSSIDKKCLTSKSTIDELYIFCKKENITQSDLDFIFDYLNNKKVDKKKFNKESTLMEKLLIKSITICEFDKIGNMIIPMIQTQPSKNPNTQVEEK